MIIRFFGYLCERLCDAWEGFVSWVGAFLIWERSVPSGGTCVVCSGTGYFMPGQRDCPACFGSGVAFDRCPACGKDHQDGKYLYDHRWPIITTSGIQGDCPECKGPFEYWPEKDGVVLGGDGLFRHARCSVDSCQDELSGEGWGN